MTELEVAADSSPEEPAAATRRSVTEVVGRLARLARVELDTAELARGLAPMLLDVFARSRATVALEDHRRVSFAVTATRGSDRLVDPDDAMARVLRSLDGRQQVVIRAVGPGDAPRNAHPLAQALRDAGLTAAGETALIPVRNHQERCVCQMLLVARAGRVFSPADLELAETFADQVSVGIERARVLGRLGEWTRGLQALLAFSAEINRQRDAPVLIRHLVEHAGHFLEAEGGLSGLREEDEHGPHMVSTGYWTGGAWREGIRRWRHGEGVPGHLLASEFPCLVDDYRRDPRADEAYRERYGVRFAISVPIKSSAGTPVGFFELHRGARQQPFTWQDAAFLESLANTTAVAIENVQLVDQLEVKSRQVRSLSAENVNRLEEERRYISRELHDEAGQALVGIKLGLQVLARRQPQETEALRDQLAELSIEVNRATQQIKNLAQRLRPPALDRLGLDMALQQLADEFSGRGLSVKLTLSLSSERLPEEVETALFRIAQEALTNTALHGDAREVRIALEADVEQIRLSIADDGVGFDGDADRGGGLGLLGIRERVAILGGELTIDTGPGSGTRLEVTVRQPAEGR
ncbi:MAG: GAF domain-containing protein [Acidobacteriota bacterium]